MWRIFLTGVRYEISAVSYASKMRQFQFTANTLINKFIWERRLTFPNLEPDT